MPDNPFNSLPVEPLTEEQKAELEKYIDAFYHILDIPRRIFISPPDEEDSKPIIVEEKP